jgi:hypothetical protein
VAPRRTTFLRNGDLDADGDAAAKVGRRAPT